MQNKYVGDFGDFGKYALLRYLVQTDLPLGVNWYLTPDENHSNDGKHTAYLQNDRMAGYDDEVLSLLRYLVVNQRRNTREIETSGILSTSTVYYSCPLDWTNVASGDSRSSYRRTWHEQALLAMKHCGLVFLDPDNGLQVKSVPLTNRKGNKYIGFHELQDYIQSGKSVVFYNHRERMQEDAYLNKFRKLREDGVLHHTELLGIKFSGGTVRDYIFFLQPEHATSIFNACNLLLGSVWRSHFSRLAL
jgi:hypothetical protein